MELRKEAEERRRAMTGPIISIITFVRPLPPGSRRRFWGGSIAGTRSGGGRDGRNSGCWNCTSRITSHFHPARREEKRSLAGGDGYTTSVVSTRRASQPQGLILDIRTEKKELEQQQTERIEVRIDNRMSMLILPVFSHS